MTFAMIAAGALLSTVGQPKDPSLTVGLRSERAFHWMIVPGGGVFPMPTPFMVLVPLGRFEEARTVMSPKLRQELHIVIQSEKDGVINATFTKAVVEGLKQIIEQAQEPDRAVATTVPKSADCKKTDPKQVIEPIVTGF